MDSLFQLHSRTAESFGDTRGVRPFTVAVVLGLILLFQIGLVIWVSLK
jgi:hypothetical protein